MPRRNVLAIALVGAVSLLCWQSGQGARDKDDVMDLYGVFVDTVEQVEANYVRPVSRRELLESALNGMLHELDPYSEFMSASRLKAFKTQIEGSFGGIGITVQIDPDTNRLKVIAPMVGTPAYAAGIRAADLILEVDGKSTEGFGIDRSVEALQGRTGTQVTLKVLHENEDKPIDVTVTRAIIEVPNVIGDLRKSDDSWDFMVDKDNKIGYIRIKSFIQRTAEELAKAIEELKSQGMKGLVIDLRDNGGGLLTSAVEISDLFVEDGPIVSTKGRNTREKVYRAKKDGTFSGFPMAVLINGNSASASEILAACLQDTHRAVVVGQRSFGKGSVQNVIPLEDGNSLLRLTVSTYHRPSGKNIHRFKNAKDTDEWGVQPDPECEVKLNTNQYVAWFLGRRDRDLISKSNPIKPEGEAPKEHPEVKDDAKAKGGEPQGKDEAKEEPKAKAQARPSGGKFVDKQLEKALAVVRGKLSQDAAAKGDAKADKG